MTISWAEDYQPVVYNLFMMGVDMVPSLIPALYNVQTSNSAFEYFLGLEGTDVEGWNAYKTSGETAYADFDRGFPKTFQHFNYTRNFKLLQDYIEDGTLNGAAQMAIRGLGISAAQKRETDAASTFVGAFTASAPYLGPDGVALCSASHPYSRSNADVYDNTGTESFSYTALTNAREELRDLKDGVGNPLMRNGTLILHPIELQKEVDEVLFATGKPGTANNDGTSARGFTALAWDFLTNAKDWWLIDPVWAKQSLFWFNRVNLYNQIVEVETTHVVYQFRMRYSWGFIDPRFVYGNDVT
jgi:hypothetical protein